MHKTQVNAKTQKINGNTQKL